MWLKLEIDQKWHFGYLKGTGSCRCLSGMFKSIFFENKEDYYRRSTYLVGGFWEHCYIVKDYNSSLKFHKLYD